jgi:hypothetical protein
MLSLESYDPYLIFVTGVFAHFIIKYEDIKCIMGQFHSYVIMIHLIRVNYCYCEISFSANLSKINAKDS